MTRFLTVAALWLVFCLWLANGAFAQSRPGDVLRWDQPTAEVVSIQRFEVSWDDAAFADAGKVEANDTQTPTGFTSYRVTLPALTVGAHTVRVRACPATGNCGPASQPLAFSIIVISAPSGLRIGG